MGGKESAVAYSAKGTEQQCESDGRGLAEEESSVESRERFERVCLLYHAWHGRIVSASL